MSTVNVTERLAFQSIRSQQDLNFGNGLKLRPEDGNSENSLQRGNPAFTERETNINKLHPHMASTRDSNLVHIMGGAVLQSLRHPCNKVKFTLRPCLTCLQGGEVTFLGGVKNNPPLHAILQPSILRYTFSRLLNGR